jgi:inositol 1,4,5-triphosphate receptor type 1
VDHYKIVFFALGGLHILTSALVVATFYLLHPPSVRASLCSLPVVGTWVAGWTGAAALGEGKGAQRTQSSLLSMPSVYHIVFLVLSVMGLLYHGYFFGFHFLHIVVNNDILLRVIQSVTKNGDSLVWVFGFMVVIIYIYSLFVFAFMRAYQPVTTSH